MRVNYKKLKAQIPSSVSLGSTKKSVYEVVWIDVFNDPTTLGETTFDKKQIRIKNGLSDKLSVVTYIHELLHAISNETNANLTENQILALEKTFYYCLKNNNIFDMSKENK